MPNIFEDVPRQAAAEQIDLLLARPGLRIERIVSTGQASPEGFWYDQPQDEWVIVLRGAAGLLVEGEAERTSVPGISSFCRRESAIASPSRRPMSRPFGSLCISARAIASARGAGQITRSSVVS